MLNILHLINYPGGGSSEKYILTLAQRLHLKDCRFFLGYSIEGPLVDKAKQLGIETIKIPMRTVYDFSAAIQLKVLCRELKIDIVHTHFLRENYISVLAKLFGNKVMLVHTNHILPRSNALIKLSYKILSMMDDSITAVSQAVRDRMVAEGVNSKKIKVIYNGLDMDYWKGRRNYKIRSEFSIGRDEFVVVSVADFSEEKGHMFFIEAVKHFKRLCDADRTFNQRVRFILVGDGELFEECKRFTGMLGLAEDIIFTGNREDFKNIFHGSDLLVSHYSCEALDLSIPEALLCGIPVLASNTGGASELITQESRCGIVIDYGETEDFAHQLIQLIKNKDLYGELKSNTIKAVDERFSIETTVQETYELYIRSLRKGYG